MRPIKKFYALLLVLHKVSFGNFAFEVIEVSNSRLEAEIPITVPTRQFVLLTRQAVRYAARKVGSYFDRYGRRDLEHGSIRNRKSPYPVA